MNRLPMFLGGVAIAIGTFHASPAQVKTSRPSASFVTRSGDRLLLGGKTFRCAGVNIYWLGLDENVGGVGYPSQFRVTDALDTVKVMGGTVVRAHTLGVSTGNPLSVEPALDQFNDKAFEAIDFAIAETAKRGLKLVIPLTDNYAYYHGGRHNFTDWRGVPVEEFYSNPQVIEDFERYISHILDHKNRITGIALKDDPTIMAWETGNEIRPPSAWTATVTRYIKQNDPKHLVLDGHYGVDTASLELDSVDLVGAHFNGTAYKMTRDAVTQQTALAASKKPFFIGEFDWNNHHKNGDLDEFLPAVAENTGVAGVTLWSLFPHRDDSGFVVHKDGFTLHYPGDDAAMREKVLKLVAFFQKINGPSRKERHTLAAPLITSATASKIAWRGVAGADTYDLERSTQSKSGPWVPVSTGLLDSDGSFTLKDGPAPSWYRIRAHALDGTAGPYSEAVSAVSQ